MVADSEVVRVANMSQDERIRALLASDIHMAEFRGRVAAAAEMLKEVCTQLANDGGPILKHSHAHCHLEVIQRTLRNALHVQTLRSAGAVFNGATEAGPAGWYQNGVFLARAEGDAVAALKG